MLSSTVHDGSTSGHRPAYNGVYDAFRRILKQDGFTGLYRVIPMFHSVLCNMWLTAHCTCSAVCGIQCYTYSADVVEAHCYVGDIGRTDCEQIRSRINNN